MSRYRGERTSRAHIVVRMGKALPGRTMEHNLVALHSVQTRMVHDGFGARTAVGIVGQASIPRPLNPRRSAVVASSSCTLTK